MRRGPTVTLFPFLSVLLATMGILAFLAVTFLLFAGPRMAPPEPVEPVEVRWVGAPEYVRPLIVECRRNEARFHSPRAPGDLVFSRESLRREADIVRGLQEEGLNDLGLGANRYDIWFMMKMRIQNDARLAGGLTMALHRIEVGNWPGGRLTPKRAYYPILLVYGDGIEIYNLVSFLVETTTRFPVGVEPMLKGWKLPYRDLSS